LRFPWLPEIVSSFQGLAGVGLWAGLMGFWTSKQKLSRVATVPSLCYQCFQVLGQPLPRLLLGGNPSLLIIPEPTDHSPSFSNPLGICFSHLEGSPGPLPPSAHNVFLSFANLQVPQRAYTSENKSEKFLPHGGIKYLFPLPHTFLKVI
jgi:hypothetical protein